MKYIEIIVLTNMLIHFVLLKATFILGKAKMNYYTSIISCFFDGIYILFYLYFPYELESYRYLVIIILSVIPFIHKGITRCLILLLIYWMLNFTLGGSAGVLFNIMNNYYVVFICLGVLFILSIIFSIYKKYHFNINELEYEILIEDNNKKLYLNGFCDTGNFLVNYDNIPIVFVRNNIKIGRYYKTIEINTVSTIKKIPIYEVECFKIKIKNKYVKKDVYIAYGDIAFNVMFGTNLLGG